MDIGGTGDGHHISPTRVKREVGVIGTVTFCELK
jgi:hypothetical protein